MSDWIEWKGGERPVAADVPVELKFRNGEVHTGGLTADAWDWVHFDIGQDIVAYRIAAPDPETASWEESMRGLDEERRRQGSTRMLFPDAAPVAAPAQTWQARQRTPDGWTSWFTIPYDRVGEYCQRSGCEVQSVPSAATPEPAPSDPEVEIHAAWSRGLNEGLKHAAPSAEPPRCATCRGTGFIAEVSTDDGWLNCPACTAAPSGDPLTDEEIMAKWDKAWKARQPEENAATSQRIILHFASLLLKARAERIRRIAAPVAAPPPDPWRDAVLEACISVEACFRESDPRGTVNSLIDWHLKNDRDFRIPTPNNQSED